MIIFGLTIIARVPIYTECYMSYHYNIILCYIYNAWEDSFRDRQDS